MAEPSWVQPVEAPPWLADLVASARPSSDATVGPGPSIRPSASREGSPPAVGSAQARRSAVLVLFGPIGARATGAPRREPDHVELGGHGHTDVLLTERAVTLRAHAGQVAFPGGRVDPADDGTAAAALREAQEETGLDPAGVQVIGTLPDQYIRPSNSAVTPVLGWWRRPSPIGVGDPAEVSRSVRVPISELVDPANRFQAHHPSGFTGPAFGVRGLFIWGFTAGLLAWLLRQAGWERPWEADRLLPIPGAGR